QPAGVLDHLRRRVDALRLVEVERECPGEAADPAAEVERAFMSFRAADLRSRREDLVDLSLAGCEEIVEVPAAVPLGIDAEDSPERIHGREVVPIPRLPRLSTPFHSLAATTPTNRLDLQGLP